MPLYRTITGLLGVAVELHPASKLKLVFKDGSRAWFSTEDVKKVGVIWV